MGLSFIFDIFVTSIFEAFYFQIFRNLTNFDPPKKKVHNRNDTNACLCCGTTQKEDLHSLDRQMWYVVQFKFSEKAKKI